ncbi:hypothetical protein V8E55_010533 [Tylopilus felleus]
MLSPQDVWPARLRIAIGFISDFQAMLVDAILLVHLITAHPPEPYRLLNIMLYVKESNVLADGPNVVDSARLAMPSLKIEWIAEAVDNSYASIAFIWTIRNFRTSTMLEGAVTLHESSLAGRIRILSNLALSNVITPTLISVVQLVLIFRIGDANLHLVSYFGLVNARVSIFGVVFATVWAGKEHRREANTMFAEAFPAEREQRRRIRLHPRVSVVHIGNDQSDNTTISSMGRVSI